MTAASALKLTGLASCSVANFALTIYRDRLLNREIKPRVIDAITKIQETRLPLQHECEEIWTDSITP